jgi:hypothetical protein
MQNAADERSSVTYRTLAAVVCVVTVLFALYAGALGGLGHAVQFSGDRAGDLASRPHTAPAASPATPMWLTVPCRRMLIWPARIDQIGFCANPKNR